MPPRIGPFAFHGTSARTRAHARDACAVRA